MRISLSVFIRGTARGSVTAALVIPQGVFLISRHTDGFHGLEPAARPAARRKRSTGTTTRDHGTAVRLYDDFLAFLGFFGFFGFFGQPVIEAVSDVCITAPFEPLKRAGITSLWPHRL